MTATLAALGCRNADSSSRQPDYYVGSSGIPRLVGGRAVKAVEPCKPTTQSGAVDQHRKKMNQCGASGGISLGTDPVKLNKCLHNLTVRNGNGSSRIETGVVIRSQFSHKSKYSSTRRSVNDSNSNQTGAVSSASSSYSTPSTSTVLAMGLGGSRRSSATSSRCTSSDPRSLPNRTPPSRNDHKSSSVNGGSIGDRTNGISSRRSHSTLLNDRQRRNAPPVSDSNRFDDGECLMRQCR